VASLPVARAGSPQRRGPSRECKIDRTFFSRRGEESLDGGKRRVSAIVLFHDERDLATHAAAYAQKRHAFFTHMSEENAIYGPLVRNGE
jgi:hypothetical protein